MLARRFSFLIATLVVAIFAISAGTASAGYKPWCTKAHYAQVQRNGDWALLHRQVRRKSPHAVAYQRTYACSRVYRRLIYIGTDNVGSGGQGTRFGPFAGNSRYVAFAQTYQGDPRAPGSQRLAVLSLGQRKLVSEIPNADVGIHYIYPETVAAIAVNSIGDVAWTTYWDQIDRDGAEPIRHTEVRLHDKNGTRVLDSGTDIDPYMLRFDDETTVVWAHTAGSAVIAQ